MSGTESPVKFTQSKQLRVIAIIMGLVVTLLMAAYFFFLQWSYSPLYQDLRPAQAAAIAGELEEREIAFRVEDGGRTILVPSGNVDAVRLAIDGARSPANQLTGFELFNESDMGLTDFAQRIKFQRALQGELGRTIVAIDGIEEARVHISMPERALFRGDQASPKAAISITTDVMDVPSRSRIVGIQRLVSASVPDLLPADVVVLNDVGEVISAHDDTLYSAPLQTKDVSAQQARYLTARAEQAIETAFLGLDFEVVASVFPIEQATEEATIKGEESELTSRIIVVTDEALTPQEQGIIRTAVSEVIRFNAALGEGVEFRQRLRAGASQISGGGDVADEDTGGFPAGQAVRSLSNTRLPLNLNLLLVLSVLAGLMVLVLLILAVRFFRAKKARDLANSQFAENLRLQLTVLENA
jgi:flagellar M-ring protein FliF